jgi:hypothetical protein
MRAAIPPLPYVLWWYLVKHKEEIWTEVSGTWNTNIQTVFAFWPCSKAATTSSPGTTPTSRYTEHKDRKGDDSLNPQYT